MEVALTVEINGGSVRSDVAMRSRPGFVVLVYLFLVAAAEVVTALVHPIVGILFHSGLLAALVIHAAVLDDQGMRRLLLPLTLAPLTRILSLSMPLTIIPQIFWYPIIYLPLAAGAIVVMRQVGLSRRDVGMTLNRPLVQALLFPVGALLGLTEYMILRPAPLESQLTAAAVSVSALVFFATTGLVEEWVFRGVLQKVMGDRFGWLGLIYTSALFTVLHLGFLSLLDLGFVFAVAMLFAWVVKSTGSLLGVTLAHGLTNISLYVILPLLLL